MENMTKNQSWLQNGILAVLLVIPVVYLSIKNQGLADLLRSSAPNGQLFYLSSKFLGIYAFILLCWQMGTMLLNKLNHKPVEQNLKKHIVLGSSIMLLISLHAGFFVTAVSTRAGHINLHPLVPNFSGYFSTAVTFGVFALVLTIIAVASGAFRKRLNTKWKTGHSLMFIVMALVFFHAYMIGSDVQSASLLPLFLLSVIGVSGLAVKRFLTVRNN